MFQEKKEEKTCAKNGRKRGFRINTLFLLDSYQTTILTLFESLYNSITIRNIDSYNLIQQQQVYQTKYQA